MRKPKTTAAGAAAAQLRMPGFGFGALPERIPLDTGMQPLYRTLRQTLPILDAAIKKLVRLTGGFTVHCSNPAAEKQLTEFLRTVPCGRGQRGIDAFLTGYLDSLLTDGRAVGEMVVSRGRLHAVLWGDTRQLQIEQGDSPLDFTLCAADEQGQMRPLPYQHLLLFTPLDPEPENPYGVSMLRSMPFLGDVLLKIYKTIGLNWERAGNVRYAVVRDFVAVGDVQIQVIGADGPILDAEVPVRQILEQLVSRTGLPPFLLGLSWSSTERMSAQQVDMLTSELWGLRRAVQPALERICEQYLTLEGFGCGAEIIWDDISLQDIVDEAKSALYRAQTEALNQEE